MSRIPRITTEQVLYGGALLGGFLLRIWDLGSRAMHGDESVHAWMAWNLYNGTGYQYDPVYHGPLQFIVTSVFFFLFGPSNTTARLMAALFGTALIVVPYFFRRWMGRPAALIAAAFIAFSPALVYVSRLERDDIFSCFFALTMALGIFGYVWSRQVRYLYLLAASAALSLTAMENTYITYFIFGTFLIVAWVSEYLARSSYGSGLERFWRERWGTVCAGLGALLLLAFALTLATGLYAPVPLIAAIGIVLLVHRQVLLSAREDGPKFLPALQHVGRVGWFNVATIVVAILFLAYSAFGTDLRGIWDTTQPFFNTGHACAYNSFPLNPCRKDIVGGLFYWLSQHHVARGGQPWFYYTFLFGLYEQIAVIFGLGGVVWFLRRPTIFTSFLTYWAVLSFGVYSWAGEKFSWLMIHPLLPFTLIAAMFVADLLRHRSLFVYIAMAVLGILVFLELHSAYEVNFVNGADPVEMMVYVQSSPDTPRVADDILALSHKVTQGNSLHVSIDSSDTWPFAWYLRDMTNVAYPGYPQLLNKPFSRNPVIIVDEANQASLLPKLGNRYSGHRYRLRWWFPEDYKTLSWRSFGQKLVSPGYWGVVTQWLIQRRPFGPKEAIWFYYYVKHGLASPY